MSEYRILIFIILLINKYYKRELEDNHSKKIAQKSDANFNYIGTFFVSNITSKQNEFEISDLESQNQYNLFFGCETKYGFYCTQSYTFKKETTGYFI